MPYTTPVLAATTVSALPTRLEYLDGYSVAGRHAPPLLRPRTDGRNRPDRLVARYEGLGARQGCGSAAENLSPANQAQRLMVRTGLAVAERIL